MKVIPYSENEAERWDAFVNRAAQGIFLHTRRYLSYHGNRFIDRSVLLENDKGELRGLFPAALVPGATNLIASHPGLTYGGLLHESGCRADEVLEMLQTLFDWYRTIGFDSLLYKVVPVHVQRHVVQSDIYALWRLGANLVRRDLWNAIDLSQPRAHSKGHAWTYKKALKSDLVVEKLSLDGYEDFHSMLNQSLFDHHATSSVHSCEELVILQRLFPDVIELWGCLTASDKLVAAVWLFKLSNKCWHTQYITASQQGRDLYATNFLLETIISSAQKKSVSNFSFGSSTENGGKELNRGLFGFKAGFGGGTTVQDFYEVNF
jgi:hypothetical protein